MEVLLLDDDPARHKKIGPECIGHTVTHVTTAQQAINALQSRNFDIVCLDHDLDGKTYVESGPGTGFEVAEFMAHRSPKPRLVIVHSFNQAGAERMMSLLKSGNHNAFYVPFSLLTLRNI